MQEPRPLHRLFGLTWIDFFQGTAVEVVTELDLSLKLQFLDLVLIRKEPGLLSRRLPDGFDNLTIYNLVTFKSYQETLDDWALCELIGHYVNYRKQSSPSLQNLLPEGDYRLYAVCARYPQQLAQQVTLAPVEPGVYEVQVLARRIRIIAVSQLPQTEHNAMLHLFSARAELLRYGQAHYHLHSRETSTLLYQMLRSFEEEPEMADKRLEALWNETVDEILANMSVEERLKRLSVAERLKGLPAEERLKGLSAEELAKALSPEVLEALARKLKTNGSSSTLL